MQLHETGIVRNLAFAPRSAIIQNPMNGKLADHPLAELIREIGSKSLSGALRLEFERARTAIYFVNGRITFAASNIRTLRLREYLKKQGLISEQEFAGLETPSADINLAASMRDAGKLSQRDFDSLLAALVADVLRVPLLWTEGTWEFDERARLEAPVEAKLNAIVLLREAAQRLPLKFVSLRLLNPNETISRSADSSGNTSFLPAESFILSRLDEPMKLEELVAVSGLRDLDAHRVIYGLALGGFVQREHWQNAFRTEPASTAPQVTAQVQPDAEEVKPDVTDRWATAQEASSEDSLGDFLERLRAAETYYEVLDVEPRSTVNEIKEAYYGLARRFHPDRFHLKSGTRLHEQISSAFARITQAYETLIDGRARSTYDATIKRAKKYERAAPKSNKAQSGAASSNDEGAKSDPIESSFAQAERYFREGFGCLQQGQINTATTHLAAAARLNPQEARFRAYYGRALANNEKARRLAETEMQTAVKLDPSNPLYRTMLAELYCDLKFYRRAQTELDKALELDPNNASAHALVRKLANLH